MVTIGITNVALAWSPYSWYTSGSSYRQTIHAGASVKTGITGTSFAVTVDVSPLTGASVAANMYPILACSIDGVWTRRQLLSSDTTVTLASGLSAGTHTVVLVVAAMGFNIDRWVTPVSVCRLTAFVIDDGASVSAPTTYSRNVLVFGDSHGEGYDALLASGGDLTGEDATKAYPYLLSSLLRAEIGALCISGQGYGVSFANVPALYASQDEYSNGHSRLSGGVYVPQPDVILICMGDNDNDAPGTSDYVGYALTAIRAAAPLVPIVLAQAPNLVSEAEIREGWAAISDANSYVIDHDADLLSTPAYTHDIHLSEAGHVVYAAAIAEDLTALGFGAPVPIAGVGRARLQVGM